MCVQRTSCAHWSFGRRSARIPLQRSCALPTYRIVIRRRRIPTDAGASAEARFQESYRPWLRRVRLFFPVALLPLAPFLAATVWWRPELLEAALGFLVGVAMTTYVWAVEPPEWMQHWRAGADGERRTAAALGDLGPEWHVVHDVPDGRGNIDHIAVGPAGVFVIETKNLNGKLRIEDEAIVQRFRFGGDGSRVNAGRYVRGAAARTSEALRDTGLRLWVRAVVVVWGDLEDAHHSDRLTILPGDDLASWLRVQPPALAPAAQVRAREVLVNMKRERGTAAPARVA